MKIGIDGRFWNESGVGRYVRNLVWELEKIDKKNSYVLFTSNKNQPKLKNPNWKIVTTDIHWHSIEEQIKLPQLINKENLDLMHFPYFSVPILYRRPYVITIHDLILHHFATGKATTKSKFVYWTKLLGYKYILNKAAKNAQRIIVVSKSTKDEVVKHLNVSEEKVRVIYEGIEINTNQKKIMKLKTNYLLHVGNLYPHKNMNSVLYAMKNLMEEGNTEVRLAIAGKEDHFYSKFKAKVHDLGLEDQVDLLGEVNEEELNYLYRNAAALVSPSLMEGFDLPVVEAMANKCLVLASDIPVHREICKDAAIYFDLKDEEDLVSKIKEVYKNGKEEFEKKLNMGKAISSEFSWEKMAVETIKIYEGL